VIVDRQQASPRLMKDRALPHIGRDAVKIDSPDAGFIFVVRGTSALTRHAKQGKSR
jgi:hypothetical protein